MEQRALVERPEPRESQPERPQPPSSQALEVVDDAPVTMFERLARDPGVPVEKLEKLIALQERVADRHRQSAFDAAFAAMQVELPVIAEKGRTDKAKFARFEDIIRTVRPILHKHGFSLSFETLWPEKGTIEIVGLLTHREGHVRTTRFIAPADDSGSKNRIQSQGSTISYGRRYTTLDLLGIATGDDDDGQRAGVSTPAAPDGIGDWVLDMESKAEEGVEALEAAWKVSPDAFKRYMQSTPDTKQRWTALKLKAKSADARRTNK